MISAVIVTLNEAHKLVGCLESIKQFAGEVIIVDLGSEDNTLEVCNQFKVTVSEHKFVSYVEEVRGFSISQSRGDWILVLDPDERVQSGLISELKKIVEEKDYVAVNIPRKNIFFGKWIAHTNFWPDRQIRFFKKSSVVWPKRIHAYPIVTGPIYNLPAKEELSLLHFGYAHVGDFVRRQQRYSSIEAKSRLQLGKSFNLVDFVWMPLREFLVRFIKHQGYKDGWYGFVIVLLLMYYQILVELKMLKLQMRIK